MESTFAEQPNCSGCGSPLRYGSQKCAACGTDHLFKNDRLIDVERDSLAILKRLGYIIEEDDDGSGFWFRRTKKEYSRQLYTSSELINVVCIEAWAFFEKPQSIAKRQLASRYVNINVGPVKATYDKDKPLDDVIELRVESVVKTEGQFVLFVTGSMNWLKWAEKSFYEKYDE